MASAMEVAASLGVISVIGRPLVSTPALAASTPTRRLSAMNPSLHPSRNVEYGRNHLPQAAPYNPAARGLAARRRRLFRPDRRLLLTLRTVFFDSEALWTVPA